MPDVLDNRVLKTVVRTRSEALRRGYDHMKTEYLVSILSGEGDRIVVWSLQTPGAGWKDSLRCSESLVGSSKGYTGSLALFFLEQEALGLAVVGVVKSACWCPVVLGHLLCGLTYVRRSVTVRGPSDHGVSVTDMRRGVGRMFCSSGHIVGVT